MAFHFLRICQWCTQTNSNIVSEMVAADGDYPRVGDRAFVEDDYVRRSSSDIDEAYSKIALVGIDDCVGASERLKHNVVNVNARPVRRRHQILGGSGRRSNHVGIHFEAQPNHARRILNATLLVDNEFLRQQVDRLAIGRQ